MTKNTTGISQHIGRQTVINHYFATKVVQSFLINSQQLYKNSFVNVSSTQSQPSDAKHHFRFQKLIGHSHSHSPSLVYYYSQEHFLQWWVVGSHNWKISFSYSIFFLQSFKILLLEKFKVIEPVLLSFQFYFSFFFC